MAKTCLSCRMRTSTTQASSRCWLLVIFPTREGSETAIGTAVIPSDFPLSRRDSLTVDLSSVNPPTSTHNVLMTPLPFTDTTSSRSRTQLLFASSHNRSAVDWEMWIIGLKEDGGKDMVPIMKARATAAALAHRQQQQDPGARKLWYEVRGKHCTLVLMSSLIAGVVFLHVHIKYGIEEIRTSKIGRELFCRHMFCRPRRCRPHPCSSFPIMVMVRRRNR